MDEVINKAQNIFKNRQKHLDKINDETKRIILYVEHILNIFESSNLEDSIVFVWHVCLYIKENHLECKISFLENESDTKNFFSKASLNVRTPRMLIYDAMLSLDNLKIPSEMLEDINAYFKLILYKYFSSTISANEVIITLRKETNCET